MKCVISRVKMLTNFLHALVQSWDSASGQMAPIPPTVWLGDEGCGVRVCARARDGVRLCASLTLCQLASETHRKKKCLHACVWITAGPRLMSLNNILSFDCPQCSL